MNKNTLELFYIKNGLSIRECADKLKTSHGTVHKALVYYGIQRRPSMKARSVANQITKPDLYYKYIVEGMTIGELAKYYKAGTKTVSQKLREFEIVK
jgi:hypothetical protein